MFSHLKSFLSNNLDFLNTPSSNVVISNVNKFLIYESENHINHDNDEDNDNNDDDDNDDDNNDDDDNDGDNNDKRFHRISYLKHIL